MEELRSSLTRELPELRETLAFGNMSQSDAVLVEGSAQENNVLHSLKIESQRTHTWQTHTIYYQSDITKECVAFTSTEDSSSTSDKSNTEG